jgi:hypothetical protein
MKKRTIGKITRKRYRCSKCGHLKKIKTNHYGQTYSCGNLNCCPECPPYKRPTVWVCTEKLPEGWKRPPSWKQVHLSEICDVT